MYKEVGEMHENHINYIHEYDLDIKITIIVHIKGLWKLSPKFKIKWILMKLIR